MTTITAPIRSGQVQPPPELGQVVYWYDGGVGSSPPQPAVVTGVGLSSVALNIIDPTTYNFRIRDGVRHIADPMARRVEFQESGAWDHTPATKRLLKLEAQVRELLTLVEPVKK